MKYIYFTLLVLCLTACKTSRYEEFVIDGHTYYVADTFADISNAYEDLLQRKLSLTPQWEIDWEAINNTVIYPFPKEFAMYVDETEWQFIITFFTKDKDNIPYRFVSGVPVYQIRKNK